MTFIDHGIQGALVYAVPLTIAGAPDEVKAFAMGVGFGLGSWPDIHPAVQGFQIRKLYPGFAVYFGYDWPTYNREHDGPVPWWNIPRHVHLAVDRMLHKPDGDWWPREWKLCTLYWIAEIALLFFVCR